MDAPRPVVSLTLDELRATTAYGADRARTVLHHFAGARPDDARVLDALLAADEFSQGAPRRATLRSAAWTAHRAGQEAGSTPAAEAARAAMSAAAAAFLHPLARPHQVKHILGAAAHAARAVELAEGNAAASAHLVRSRELAGATVRAVLLRYPAAPAGGGRVGELVRTLDEAVRGSMPPDGPGQARW
ncbi:exonuclease SbcC [Isoptericola halotolerans]|uniref:putative immunity protein n=1 Tax=Isoptericola halotolerans TaxID=300560 RepID=UPI0038908D34